MGPTGPGVREGGTQAPGRGLAKEQADRPQEPPGMRVDGEPRQVSESVG